MTGLGNHSALMDAAAEAIDLAAYKLQKADYIAALQRACQGLVERPHAVGSVTVERVTTSLAIRSKSGEEGTRGAA